MKIKKIEIKNLNSIEEACIDFSVEPLKNEWLFLICGATGTGKSTILDAITLALFDKAARYSFIQNKEKIGEEPTNSTSHMLRRGTAEGYAKVFFDVMGTEYIATWRRSKARTGTFHQHDRRKLERIGIGGIMLMSDKVKEVNGMISDLIGVSYEQFMRSVMLAQGHFNTFLTSDKSEQAEILEMLTGTKIYSDIAAAINEKKNKAFGELKSLEDQRLRENKDIISDDELESLRQRKDSLQRQIQDECLIQSDLTKKKLWRETRNNIVADLKKAEIEYNEKKAECESVDFKHNEWIVKTYNETVEIRGTLSENLRQKQSERDIIAEIDRIRLRFSDCCHALETMKVDLDKKKNSLNDDQNRFEASRHKENLYREIGKVITLLNETKRDKSTLKAMEEALRQMEDKIKKAEADLTKKRELTGIASDDYDKKNDAFHLADARCKDLDISVLQDNHNILNDKKQRKEKLRVVLDQVQGEMNKYWTKEQQILDCQKDIDKIVQELTAIDDELKDSQTLLQQAVAIYDKNKSAVEDWAREYRAVLQEGDPCPVCGNTSHIYVDDSAIASLVQRLEHDVKEAEQKMNDVKDRLNKKQSDLNSEKKSLVQLQNDLNVSRDMVYRLCQKELLPTQEMIAEKISACDNEINTITEQLLSSKEALDNALQLTKDRDRARDEKDKAMSVYDKAKEACKTAENDLKLLIGQRDSKEEGKSQKGKDIEDKIAELDKLMTDDKWRAEWEANTDNYAKLIENDANEWLNLEKSIERQKSYLEDQYELVKVAEERKNIILSLLQDFVPADVHDVKLDGRIDELLYSILDNLRSKLSEQNNISKEIEKTQDILDHFFSNRTDGITSEVLSDLNDRNDINEVRQCVEAIKNACLETKTTLENKRKDLDNHDNSMTSANEVEQLDVLQQQLSSCEEKIKECREEFNRVEVSLNTDAQLRGMIDKLQKDIDAKKVIANRWEVLSQAIGSTDKNNFRNYAQSYTMAILLDKANEFLIQLSSRYQLYCDKGSFAIQVTDLSMGGERRAASSLSGGESFLVSLSLALGLASLNDQNIEMDMLFIDEGFGTLDGESLDMVMTTLENLKGLRRKVGIISHVESLRERIPVKITLKKKSKAVSCVEIVRS